MRLVLLLLGVGACGFQAPGGQPGPEDASTELPVDARDPRPDAPPDAPPEPPMWRVVETLMVPCTGVTVTSNVVLDPETPYRLRATGTCVANDNSGSRADAEYAGWGLFGGVSDVVSQVDIGIAIDDPTPRPSNQPDWGSATLAHDYVVDWPGTGRPLSATFHDPDLTNNSGQLTLTILAYR